MNCHILDTSVLSVIDGKSLDYSGLEGKLKKGNKFTLNYIYTSSKNIDLTLSVTGTDKALFSVDLDTISSDTIDSFHDSNLAVLSHKRLENQKVSFGSNYIRINSNYHGEIRLTRYYKGDWSGIYNGFSSADTVETHTLECKSNINKVDEIVEALKERANTVI
jgi:hypothetical protein